MFEGVEVKGARRFPRAPPDERQGAERKRWCPALRPNVESPFIATLVAGLASGPKPTTTTLSRCCKTQDSKSGVNRPRPPTFSMVLTFKRDWSADLSYSSLTQDEKVRGCCPTGRDQSVEALAWTLFSHFQLLCLTRQDVWSDTGEQVPFGSSCGARGQLSTGYHPRAPPRAHALHAQPRDNSSPAFSSAPSRPHSGIRVLTPRTPPPGAPSFRSGVVVQGVPHVAHHARQHR